jgi:thiamine biosynthesis lipoprotein
MTQVAQSSGPIRHLEEVMGTVVVIDVYTESTSDLIAGRVAEAVAVLHRADEIFSLWKDDSPALRWRRGDLAALQAPAELLEVVGLCSQACAISEGWFDPWALPGGPDLTGYVKGWAAQRALEKLAGDDVTRAVVNAAGDIAIAGPALRVGIVDPRSPGQFVAMADCVGALATSGNYERGRHLFNPRDGSFASALASASVTGPELGLADAMATALAVGGYEVLEIIETMSDYEAFTVAFDGEQRWTTGFPLIARAADGRREAALLS